MGTSQALAENDRESMTITIKEVSPFAVGMLIALFERAVGFYASLVNINAYHQPGVEAGKKAAGNVIAIQRRILELVFKKPRQHLQWLKLRTRSKLTMKLKLSSKFASICPLIQIGISISSLTDSPFTAKYSLA